MPNYIGGGSNVGSSQIIDNEIINADIDDNAGIVYTKLNLAGSIVDTDIAPTNLLPKLKIVNLSAADIIAMKVTPVEIIAAPAAGQAIIIDEVIFSFTPGGTQFTGGGIVSLAGPASVSICNAADINGAVVKYFASYPTTATPVAATPLTITNATANFATGNGTAKIQIKYRVVTL